jgi:hypothetical protein
MQGQFYNQQANQGYVPFQTNLSYAEVIQKQREAMLDVLADPSQAGPDPLL